MLAMKIKIVIIYFLCLIYTPLSFSQSTFYQLGRSYSETEKYDEAIRLTKQSVGLDSLDSDRYNLLLDYLALSEYYSYIAMPDSCLIYVNKSIDTWHMGAKVEYSSVLSWLSHSLFRAGFSQKAIEYRFELLEKAKQEYGENSPHLLGEYRILSSFYKQLSENQLSVKYAKLEEDLAYRTKYVNDYLNLSINYSSSLGWLRYVIQDCDEPISGADYLLRCINEHKDLVDSNERGYTFNTIAAISSDLEKSERYYDAIQLKKLIANEDKNTDYYIDDLVGIARCYSHTSSNDSTIYYCDRVIDLAEKLINVHDSIAEECIQSTVWALYGCGEYNRAVASAKKVLELRKKIHGPYSDKYFEWIGLMSYQALKFYNIEDIKTFCAEEIESAKQAYGINSKYYTDAISSIRAYAHQMVDHVPEFTTKWVVPYYQELIENNILPQFQYEFEILQLEGHLALNDLQKADTYAHKLEHWTYDSNSNDIPLDDQIRIWLKLANYDRFIGDHLKARWRLMESDKKLEAANKQLSITQLVDRHIVELNLRVDTLGRHRINAEWLIETSSPIIEAGIEDSGIISFFYNSRAWAYEGLEDYDKAIDDIKKSIELNPLYSRKKKLGQLYLHKRNYVDAEKVFLELYNDESLPKVGRESVEADFVALYWRMGEKDKLLFYIEADIDNLKEDTRKAFAFLSEKERESFLNNSLLGSTIYFDMYTSFSVGDNQWPKGNEMAYNLALIQKGLLLNTTKEISDILNNVPDSLQNYLRIYTDLKSLAKLSDYEDPLLRESRIKLMNFVVAQPNFMAQLNDNWENVLERLSDHEAAIEFINLLGVQPDNADNYRLSLGALIIRNDAKFPIFVQLATNEEISNCYEYGEDNERFDDVIYSGEAKRKIYKAIWEPLTKYLDGIETIYYAPVGPIHEINLDWIGNDDSQNLSSNFNLYRVSSTREIFKRRQELAISNAILYGDISYSTKSSQMNLLPKSKFRSMTRAGFTPLNKTAIEIDSIVAELNSDDYSTIVYRKLIATENTFRNISGNSPRVLHIATHGFYYSKEAIEEEYQYGNFIAFQGMNPELYHSGLALSGAQDTWNYARNPEEITKYLELDSDNDGILLSAEISNMDLSNTDLVVLSACETALGNVTVEGVYGLQRAFKLAGVNSILMSLWKVDDDATQLLMASFYRNYLNGMSKREALLAAQQKVKSTPGFEDPYYWAAFILLDALN
jgi:CHAT domain-containing protein